MTVPKIKYPILSAYYLFHLKGQVREKHFTLKTDKILERTKRVLLITLQHLKFMAKLTTLCSLFYTEHKYYIIIKICAKRHISKSPNHKICAWQISREIR